MKVLARISVVVVVHRFRPPFSLSLSLSLTFYIKSMRCPLSAAPPVQLASLPRIENPPLMLKQASCR